MTPPRLGLLFEDEAAGRYSKQKENPDPGLNGPTGCQPYRAGQS